MFKTSRILAAAIITGACLHGVSHGQAASEYFWHGVQDEATFQLCSNERFLDIGKLSEEECKKMIDMHAMECRTTVERLRADMSTSLQIYVMCLQSSVLLYENGEL